MASGSNDEFGKIINLLMLGKAGSGKSRTGNSILGDKNAFVFGEPTDKWCVKSCYKRDKFVKQINVIDTPSGATLYPENMRSISEGLKSNEKSNEICNHCTVCVICVPIGRFSDDDLQIYSKYTEYFEDHLLQFSILVFTYFDKWENDMDDRGIENPNFNSYIDNLSDAKKALLHKFGDRFVMFNNRTQDKENEQVDRLLKTIEEILKKGSHNKLLDILKKSAVNFTKAASSIITEKSAKMTGVVKTFRKYWLSNNNIDGTNGRKNNGE